MDATKLELMRTIGEAYSPYLETGKFYHKDVIKSSYGSQSSGMFYTKDGIKYNHNTQLSEKEQKALNKELRELRDNINGLRGTVNLDELYYDLPGNTKVRFTFVKDQPVAMQVYGVAELILDLKEELLEKTMRVTDQGAFKKAVGMGEFVAQADEINVVGNYSVAFENKTFSRDSFYGLGLDLLNTALEEQLQRIWFRLEDDTITVQTEPAFPEHDLHPIADASVDLDPA